ncbi:HAMP domain-containing sensor histidine kinase [Ectobacillus panaciterrae]|uniref:HAMP domain-containing sensor histidine kinase n=1 Tax=Ectobacillus panaciterrae TaxID=363872 RepID=UPI00040C8334|nr:HAMP domain-containing sensor histidine kinase [Ectobacillus panaciterrae]
MDIKWKNRIAWFGWFIMLTIGISGVLSIISNGGEYAQKDYFHTQAFLDTRSRYLDLLSAFNLNYISKEDAKQKITVTDEQIKEHRYRYGDLSEQITNIKQQYEGKIQEALAAGNKDAADLYTAERDKKIADITNNFKDDAYVREKVVKETEKQVDEYYKALEQMRSEYEDLDKAFKYYLKDTSTGKVHTNLNTEDYKSAQKLLNEPDMLFISHLPESTRTGSMSTEGRGLGIETGFPVTYGSFQGIIAVPKWVDTSSSVMSEYKYYQQSQKRFFIYAAIAVLMLLVSMYLYKTKRIQPFAPTDRWKAHYTRAPIDVRIVFFLVTALIAFVCTTENKPFSFHSFNVYMSITNILTSLLISALFVTIAFMQAWLLREELKQVRSLHNVWKRTLLYKMWQALQRAFLIRSVGAQVFILLFIVFSLGFGAIFVAIYNASILLYVPACILLGIPIIIYIVKNTGYFNRIVTQVNELASGNLQQDLPVTGKTALADLAKNINILKSNVTSSQKEQAKSERLKTELITNVSHDLRTPLTSIITYTELLKTPELTDDERAAYVEIIDRKSKRLKVLIDDLFEASKMVSGSIELAREKADIVQLLQQTLAEHDDKIKESTLQFRVTNSEKHIYAFVDGQKMWRVFDNLISNILKYSLEHSRVYISVNCLQDKAVITFKNVSKYELGKNTDELLERFKRGDTSRHTDGSGLGLAIAKSIVDLHDGSLDIELDGDLFKVTVALEAILN